MTFKVKFNEIKNKKILKIELNNPLANNAINLEMLDTLIDKLENKKYIDKFRCILLTGYKKGPFCAGADLKDIKYLLKTNNLDIYHKKMSFLLDLINKLNDTNFIMSYSYGRALQQSALKFWSKNINDIEGTQKIFNHRAKMNTLAAQGKWSKEIEI